MKKKEIRKIKISALWTESYSKALRVVRHIKTLSFFFSCFLSLFLSLIHSSLDSSLDIQSLIHLVSLFPLRPLASFVFLFILGFFPSLGPRQRCRKNLSANRRQMIAAPVKMMLIVKETPHFDSFEKISISGFAIPQS